MARRPNESLLCGRSALRARLGWVARAHRVRPLAYALLCALLGVACATTTTQQAQAGRTASALPPVPENPLDLVVWGPEAVAVLQVQALRSSAAFARLQPYIERATCVQLADWDELLSSTRRAVLAARSQPEGAQWLLVLDGRYVEADARRVLRAALREAPRATHPGPITRDASGRFIVAQERELAVSVLDDRLIVVGSQAWVHAALDSITKPAAKFSDARLWQSLGAQLDCAQQSACVLSLANGFSARGLRSGLSEAGAKSLGSAIESADSVLALRLGEGLTLAATAELGSDDAAQRAERELRDWLWQVNLLIRLTGLPAVLDRAQLSTQQHQLRAELSLSEAELAAYDARARVVFEQAVPGCQ